VFSVDLSVFHVDILRFKYVNFLEGIVYNNFPFDTKYTRIK